MKNIILFIALLFNINSIAQTHHRKNDFGNNGRYIGGHGSSHWGGHYHSRIGNGDRYSKHTRK